VKAMRGLQLLKDHSIGHHVIAVLSRASLADPDGTLKFFTNLGINRIGFNLEEVEGAHLSSSVTSCEDLVAKFFKCAHKVHMDVTNELCIREFAHAYRLIANSPEQGGYEFVNFNQQVRPFGIISVDHLGNISTFSPELLGQHSIAYSNFLFGNIMQGGLVQVLGNPAFLAAFKAIQSGVSACAAECEYFAFCGGGSPSNKFFENGSFESTETFFCRTHLKIPFSIALEAAEQSILRKAS
jgi:uncharacterized protein